MKYEVTYKSPTLEIEADDEFEAEEKFYEKLEWMQWQPEELELIIKEVK